MLNINYDAELTRFDAVELYGIFRFSDALFMKVPELHRHLQVFTDGFNSSQHEFRPICYNAIKLNVTDAEDAYMNFAHTCKVKVVQCDLVIRD